MNSISIHDTNESPIARTPIETTIEQCLLPASQSPEPEINMSLYSSGWFDDLMGYSPELPHFKDYWDVYALGYREYYCGLLDVKIPESDDPK